MPKPMKKKTVIYLLLILLFAIGCKKIEFTCNSYNDIIFVFHEGDWIACQYQVGIINTFTYEQFDLMQNQSVEDSAYFLCKILSFERFNGTIYSKVMALDTMLKVAEPNLCKIDTAFLIQNCKKDTAGIMLKDRGLIAFKIYPCNPDSIDENIGYKYKIKARKW